MMFNRTRGQGATEYLVLLAVVLIIALVSIALLGFFPGLASDAKITQSNSYWRGDARPFQIIESGVAGSSGMVTLIMQNVEPSSITLTYINLSLSNSTSSISHSSANSSSFTFGPGETKTVRVDTASASKTFVGASGTIFEITVDINYTTTNGLVARQTGGKNMVGRYS